MSTGGDGPPPTPSPGSVRLTPWGLPVGLVIVGGCAGWTTAGLLDSAGRPVPTASWWIVAVWFLCAAAIGWGAWTTRQRVRLRQIEPLTAVRLMVLGKSAALVGPACGGFGLGLGLWRISVVPDRVGQSATLATLALGIAFLLLGVAGLALERACRVPPDRQDRERDAGAADSSTGRGEPTH